MMSLAALADRRNTGLRRQARNGILVAALALVGAAFIDAAHAAQTVELKNNPEASGPAITLGDLFVNTGDVGGRAIAPAPKPGAQAVVRANFLVAAAQAAGLSWSPPDGMSAVVVTGGAASAQRAPTQRPLALASAQQSVAAPAANAVIRRGELVTLVYIAPGLQLTTRARAMADAAIGQPIQLINLQSNRMVDAVATGPGAASANAGAAFQ